MSDTEMLLADVQMAQDAAYGDSNDTEIELLRGALEHAMRLLGLEMPTGHDPDDDDCECPRPGCAGPEEYEHDYKVALGL